jgi:hypothetical protein
MEDEITHSTWREAAGADVGDLERIHPRKRKPVGVVYKN